MNNIRTIKIKIGKSTEFDQLCKKFLDACNWISPIVYSTKQINSNSLHKNHYLTVRENFDLPSQLACSSFKNVTSAFLSQKTQKKWHPVIFRREVIPVIWKRDFSFNRKGLCFWGNAVKISDKRIPPVETWKDSKLCKKGNGWYLILCHEISFLQPKAEGCIVGVDSGIKRIFTATNSSNSKTFTFSGGELNYRRRCIRRTRAKVQSKGTKQAKRLLKRMSRHESRITTQLMHVASKELVRYAESIGARRIVMEKLSVNIRENSVNKGREFSDKVHRWPYAQGQFFVGYKAEAKGISFELVSPKNTSRGCPKCGHIDSRNRNGLNFRCLLCGYRGDADRVASINIRNRSVATRHNLVTEGSNNTPEGLELFEINSGFVVHDANLVIGLGSLPKSNNLFVG